MTLKKIKCKQFLIHFSLIAFILAWFHQSKFGVKISGGIPNLFQPVLRQCTSHAQHSKTANLEFSIRNLGVVKQHFLRQVFISVAKLNITFDGSQVAMLPILLKVHKQGLQVHLIRVYNQFKSEMLEQSDKEQKQFHISQCLSWTCSLPCTHTHK